MKTWQLQTAKARLSELIKQTFQCGSQHITIHGKPGVVVITEEEYNRLVKKDIAFVQFLRRSPLMGMKLDLKRDSSSNSNRDVEL